MVEGRSQHRGVVHGMSRTRPTPAGEAGHDTADRTTHRGNATRGWPYLDRPMALSWLRGWVVVDQISGRRAVGTLAGLGPRSSAAHSRRASVDFGLCRSCRGSEAATSRVSRGPQAAPLAGAAETERTGDGQGHRDESPDPRRRDAGTWPRGRGHAGWV